MVFLEGSIYLSLVDYFIWIISGTDSMLAYLVNFLSELAGFSILFEPEELNTEALTESRGKTLLPLLAVFLLPKPYNPSAFTPPFEDRRFLLEAVVGLFLVLMRYWLFSECRCFGERPLSFRKSFSLCRVRW